MGRGWSGTPRAKIYRIRSEAKADVFGDIERIDNTDRRRTTIGYRSPVELDASWDELNLLFTEPAAGWIAALTVATTQ
ncbi:hypothetical protein ASC80_12090 [Afipia sp. Root123D2]|nr:hypothetical protein ASC80_12090 [Afipia sp. Root123D2]